MSLPERTSRIAVGVALVAAALSLAVSLRREPAPKAFASEAQPQRALGDFDGDGRIDTALIQDHFGNRQISIQLSGSVDTIVLDGPVTGIVESDIDHDGDLDLVAATADGDLLIWLNDGHGHFERKPRRSGHGMTSEPAVVQAGQTESIAMTLRPPLVTAPARRDAKIVVTRVRPPTSSVRRDIRRWTVPSLRAPPAHLA